MTAEELIVNGFIEQQQKITNLNDENDKLKATLADKEKEYDTLKDFFDRLMRVDIDTPDNVKVSFESVWESFDKEEINYLKSIYTDRIWCAEDLKE